MASLKTALYLCASAAIASAALAQAPQPAPAGRPPMELGWSPKRTPPRPYDAPNRPWWKLSDVLAAHKGESSWTQAIVRNRDLEADWHQLAAGQRTTQVMYPDNATALIVWGGQVRVTIKGQEPFVAVKGGEVHIPFRLPFTLESVGNEPALWFEVHGAGDLPIYPLATTPDKPKDVKGFTYQRVSLSGGDGRYGPNDKPYLDYYKDVVGGGQRAGAFIAGDHLFVNNIRGPGVPTPPASDLGHYHFGYDEFWFIMEGNISYQIEGVPFFTASPGDIVIAAQGRWHRASSGGPVGQMDTRVAINPYPRGLHNFQPR
ncbi:cupin domain-containing protein [Sphingomonas quercus]|uniref:Cupin domain-containing protein n=1 Tax=Sphingomonas quercus TaxID=2842451 RepID=A0ABS6BGV5_9SPHN|nr:cupin domain-containing protein [Sphingomonas quercus]MBU3077540.1 cupin domain-containing protein [Sphingomonas quercus]